MTQANCILERMSGSSIMDYYFSKSDIFRLLLVPIQ